MNNESKPKTISDSDGFNRATRFLIFCAGADRKILSQCPNSDLVKIQGIGGVVAATGVLAFFSGSYAFYTVFGPRESLIANTVSEAADSTVFAVLFAVLFGLLWSLIIFNLDRFIVAASGPGDGTDKITGPEFLKALPRLLMAMFIGLVLAKPLEIKIMESEITETLAREQTEQYDKNRAATDRRFSEQRTRLDGERSRVLEELKTKEQGLAKLQAELSDATARYQREVQGEGGSNRGDGPIAAQLRRVVTDIEARLAQENAQISPQTESLRREAASLQQRMDALLAEKQNAYESDLQNAQRGDGLMRRIEIATKEYPWASNLLTALLIIIEIAPIIFKLMLVAGPYEYYVENEKRLAFARRGIDVMEAVKSDAGPARRELLEAKNATYAEADALTAREVGKWRVEVALTAVAMQAHQEKVAAQIRANPERYVSEDTSNDKA
jgi:hypothetical protein